MLVCRTSAQMSFTLCGVMPTTSAPRRFGIPKACEETCATRRTWRSQFGLGRSQPQDGSVFWNPNGYEWTGVFKTEVTVR